MRPVYTWFKVRGVLHVTFLLVLELVKHNDVKVIVRVSRSRLMLSAR